MTTKALSKISKDTNLAIQQAAQRLTRGVFDYHRMGFDRRPMRFSRDGTIGEGARARELYWRCKTAGKKATLEIHSQAGITCRLVEDHDRVWRGRWLCCEKMRVELSPAISRQRHKACAGDESRPASLFVLSLPRSLSTRLYHAAREAVDLFEPAWTSDGEILNADRHALYKGPTHDSSRKFISPQIEPLTFYAATEFLDQVAQAHGYAYKDVVHPFVMAEWICRRKIGTVLWIRRNVADVAYAMLGRRWHYPARLFPGEKKRERALVLGLMAAEKALASIPAIRIEFEQLIRDETILRTALKTLYPQRRIGPISFINARFKTARQEILERQKTSLYRRLNDYVMECSTAAS